VLDWQQEASERERVALLREMAALMLQRAWRRFSDRRTFAYYQELIAIKQRCDPKEVLRYVNPREADLIDAAAGAPPRSNLRLFNFPRVA
jgi:hypothetical protein